MPDIESVTGARILVTGAGGFLGRHVGRLLAERGAHVVGMTGPGTETNGLSVADICDVEAMRRCMVGCDMIVHLAGPPSVAASFRNAAEYVRTHVQGTATVLDAARCHDVQRLVYISSAEVYGRTDCEFVNEEHRLQARSPYAACKVAAEQMINAFAGAYGIDAVVLRPFSLYGPGASPDALISRLVERAIRREPIVVQDLRPVRDYCFVSDFADAVVHACSLPHAEGVRAFNVGTMKGTSVADVARMVVAAADADVQITELAIDRRPAASEIFRLVADNTRARAELGWTPSVAMEQGLRSLLGLTA